MKDLDAKEFLQQIKKINQMIKNKEIEKEQWLEVAASTTSGGKSVYVKNANGKQELHNMERVQSSGNPSKMADAIIESINIETEIESAKVRLQHEKANIIQVIEQLPVEQYTVLHLVYVQDFTLKMASYEEGISYSTVKAYHKKGIRNVQKILDRKEAK